VKIYSEILVRLQADMALDSRQGGASRRISQLMVGTAPRTRGYA